MKDDNDEIRWELGERVMASNGFVPGLFIFYYAGVIGVKWTARAARRCWARIAPKPARLLQLPPPLKALPPPDGKALGHSDH